jgi:tetratricopeptide (TPR) repeat protein
VTTESQIAGAVAASPQRLLALWQEWEQAGEVSADVALAVAKALIDMARLDEALQVLERAGDSLRARQLRALAKSKLGHFDDAIEILAALRAEGAVDAETGGLLGGCYKRRWLAHDNPNDLRAAYRTYLETYEASGDSYPGINAASLALQLEKKDESVRIAQRVLTQVTLPAEQMSEWLFATRGEAHLLLGDLPNARDWYGKAVDSNPNAVRNIAAMRRQARANLAALGLELDALDKVLVVRARGR